MAQFNHRIDLTKKEFPMLTSELGRTVLIPNDRNTPTGEASNPPEVLYMHNVMPTKRGFTSVGFKVVLLGTVISNIERIIYMYSDIAERRVYVAVPTSGVYYLNIFPYTGWVPSTLAIVGTTRLTTVAHVNGTSYLYVANFPGATTVYQVQLVAGDLVPLALIGFPLATTAPAGVTGANGYLILWTRDQIAWSSLINPLDFTPSAITGAGFGSPEGLKGAIKYCLPISTGFLIYAQDNVVAAIYTGNKQFPFKFVPVPGSSGVEALDYIAYEQNTEVHYAYTKAGLLAISANKAKPIIPELTDFLAGNQLEDFDEGTKEFTVTATADADTNLKKKVRLIAQRYLVISYGLTEFTHAIVYDLSLERMGKLRFTHVDCFDFPTDDITASTTDKERELAKESIAFSSSSGLIQVVKFEPTFSPREGVLILGKYQYHRDRHLIMQKIEVDTVSDTYNDFELTDKKLLKNFELDIIPTPTSITGGQEYYMRESALSHTLIFIGKFVLSNIQLLFTIGGRR